MMEKVVHEWWKKNVYKYIYISYAVLGLKKNRIVLGQVSTALEHANGVLTRR